MKRTFFTLTCFILLIMLSSWGSRGHRKINGNTTLSFPSQMSFMQFWGQLLSAHASDADYRRDTDPNESPKHYIDIDGYPEFIQAGTIPHSWDTIVAAHGLSFVINMGILPWATAATYDSLVSCFQRHDYNKAMLFAADLGHYIGDGHMPLHITTNYNGQYSNQTGIHSRYETTLIGRNETQIVFSGDSVHLVDNVREYIFSYVESNYAYVDSVLLADRYSDSLAGGHSSNLYYETMWIRTGNFTIDLMRRASHALAELIYTAWMASGSPLFFPDGIEENQSRTSILLGQNFPNPFVYSTTIPLEIRKENCRVTLSLFNAGGKEISTLLESDLSPGYYEIPVYSSGLPAGLYYYVLNTDGAGVSKRLLILP